MMRPASAWVAAPRLGVDVTNVASSGGNRMVVIAGANSYLQRPALDGLDWRDVHFPLLRLEAPCRRPLRDPSDGPEGGRGGHNRSWGCLQRGACGRARRGSAALCAGDLRQSRHDSIDDPSRHPVVAAGQRDGGEPPTRRTGYSMRSRSGYRHLGGGQTSRFRCRPARVPRSSRSPRRPPGPNSGLGGDAI
jgi:hypothetical protein